MFVVEDLHCFVVKSFEGGFLWGFSVVYVSNIPGFESCQSVEYTF